MSRKGLALYCMKINAVITSCLCRFEPISSGMKNSDYVIIGGGLAGSHAAQAIRENDPDGSILLVSNENHLPYDRVPLSKNYLMGKMKSEVLYVKQPNFYADQKIELLVGSKATKLDPENHDVYIGNDIKIKYKKLLLATGGQARRLSIPGSDLKGVFYLRTIDDADEIIKVMQESKNVVIIGGGFIGCELASSFTKKNISSTIIELGPKILGRVFDQDTARWLDDYFARKGVKIMTNTTPTEIVGKKGKTSGVKLQSGQIIPADFLVIGIGIIPSTDLAKDAGLEVDNGIVVNQYLQTSNPDIYAASDVARFYSPVFRRYMRLEHYDLAVKQGRLAGENMTGKSKQFEELPYFFSFMFDVRIEAYGDMSKYNNVVTKGNPIENGGFTKFYLDDGVINAVMMVTRKENVEYIKQLIYSRKKINDPSILTKDEQKIGATT
ncbi:MAG: NAD(P)/FAD-dependent oxidoreductase [Candidatus Nitrosotalea sp.]|nr:NAD(P)/FAD-dependent oxidoreductase [Candidatus Nitrosotalea sp.]